MPGKDEHFLINPFGLLYHEVTASSLVKVALDGNLVDRGSTNFGVNEPGFRLHSGVHLARPDVRCVLHTHAPAIVAVCYATLYTRLFLNLSSCPLHFTLLGLDEYI